MTWSDSEGRLQADGPQALLAGDQRDPTVALTQDLDLAQGDPSHSLRSGQPAQRDRLSADLVSPDLVRSAQAAKLLRTTLA